MCALQTAHRNQPLSVTVEAKVAYEFLISINTFSDFEHCEEYEIGREWYDAARAKIPAPLLVFMEQMGENWLFLLGSVYDCPQPKDVATFITFIETLEPFELYLRLLGYYVRYMRRATPPELLLQAAQGDRRAQKQVIKENPIHRKSLSMLLSLGVDETRKMILEIVRWWYSEVFREQEEQFMAIVERDAEAKRALQETLATEKFIEVATNGFEYVPEPAIRRVVLVPSFIARPYVSDIDHHDTMILGYAVADESLVEDSDAPPPRLVKLYKALADERRLRILKRLASGSCSLQDLMDELGLAKSTVHHHVVILRTSGLVRVRTSGDKQYSLREDALPDLTALLEAYLQRGVVT